jgi:hypothetical protein
LRGGLAKRLIVHFPEDLNQKIVVGEINRCV